MSRLPIPVAYPVRLGFDAAEGRFDVVTAATRQIRVNFFDDPARNFLMIVFVQLTQRRGGATTTSLLKSSASALAEQISDIKN